MAIRSRRKTAAVTGAIAATVLFLGVGLLPSILYGGYAGVLLAGRLFGTPVPASTGVHALVVLGSALGVTSMAGLFAVAGAVAGAAVAVILPAEAGSAREEAGG